MSDIILDTLRAELKKKLARYKNLENLMNKKHILKDTAIAMDVFASKFNASNSWEEKVEIIKEWEPINNLFKKQVAEAKRQNDNYLKWSDEQADLQSDIYSLRKEIEGIEYRESLQRRKDK